MNNIQINKAYKTELDPNQDQIKLFIKCSNAARFIFNFYLECKQILYRYGKQKVTAYGFDKELNKIKRSDYSWLYEVPNSIIQIAEQQVDTAYKNMFNRIKRGENLGFPKFKNKNNKKCFSVVTTNVHIEKDKIKLSKIGWIKLKEKGYLPTNLKMNRATVSERAGKWFISVQVEDYIEENIGKSNKVIGIDFGIKTLAVCSNGKTFENNKYLAKQEKKLKRMQRSLSRKQKESNNREKQKQKLAKVHYKLACKRNHDSHEMTSNIVKRNPSAIVIEDLSLKNMMQNHKLAKALSDVALFEKRRQLEYKSNWNGIELIVADRFFPSTQTCSACGHRKEGNDKLDLSNRIFKCENCGAEIDRDFNASLNLKKYGEDLRNQRLGRLEIHGESQVPVVEPRIEEIRSSPFLGDISTID